MVVGGLVLEAALELPAFGDVAGGGGDDQALGCLDRAEHDLHGELHAVLAHPRDVGHVPDDEGAGVADEVLVVVAQHALDPRRGQALDALARQLVGLVAEEPAHLVVGLEDDPVGAHHDHGVGGGLDERPEVRGVASLVLEAPGALEPVAGVGGQKLEGGDLVVLDGALDAGPAHQRGRQLALHPHRGGDDGAEPVGAQLGMPAGALEVVVDDDGPALVRDERHHAPVRAVDPLHVGVGEPPGVDDPVGAAVLEELAHVGGLEPELDDGVDGPGQDGVLVERVELPAQTGHPAPQAGPVLVLGGGPLAEHELSR